MKLKALIGHTALSTIPVQRICLCDLSGSFHMKEIKLTQGKAALIDDEDFDLINQFNWYANNSRGIFYAIAYISISNKNGIKKENYILMHRLLMNPGKGLFVDHINHNGLDNRRDNLRIVTHRVNHLNRIKSNKTGLCGAFKIGNSYASQINIFGKVKYIGCYPTAELAHEAYMKEFNLLEQMKLTEL